MQKENGRHFKKENSGEQKPRDSKVFNCPTCSKQFVITNVEFGARYVCDECEDVQLTEQLN